LKVVVMVVMVMVMVMITSDRGKVPARPGSARSHRPRPRRMLS
jgi:hypothetical protein